MKTPATTEENSVGLLADDEDWLSFLDPTLCKAAAAESLTHLLFRIQQAVESGPHGTQRASAALLVGIRSLYLHTAAHEAAVELYLLSLTGDLTPQDEPLPLLKAAIERGRAKVERVTQRSGKKRG
ncbi:MAG: hypothetical protein H0T60_07890 [Acidobacteria bacterium]|nr:hypothetical protein [Acidobacteriota bacterium]